MIILLLKYDFYQEGIIPYAVFPRSIITIEAIAADQFTFQFAIHVQVKISLV